MCKKDCSTAIQLQEAKQENEKMCKALSEILGEISGYYNYPDAEPHIHELITDIEKITLKALN